MFLCATVSGSRQDHDNRTADKRLPGEEERLGGPHSAPAVLCQPLGDGVRLPPYSGKYSVKGEKKNDSKRGIGFKAVLSAFHLSESSVYVKNGPFLTADMLTCHDRESTGCM